MLLALSHVFLCCVLCEEKEMCILDGRRAGRGLHEGVGGRGVPFALAGPRGSSCTSVYLCVPPAFQVHISTFQFHAATMC
jgi:hypothetical protein